MKRLFLCALVVGAVRLAMAVAPSSVIVPLRQDAPAIDGVIEEGEWRASAALTGFLHAKPRGVLAAVGGEGVAHLACDGKALYLAFRFAARNNDPGGGLAARAVGRDGDVTADDNIEVVLTPTPDSREVYHIIVNSCDVVCDRLWSGGPKADWAWNCKGFRVKSVVKAKVWECEMAIPLASVGVQGRQVLLNVVRNVPEAEAAQLVSASDCRKGPKLAVCWREDAPAIQMLPLGKPLDGAWSSGVKIAAAPSGASYVASLSVNTKYRPDVEGVRVATKEATLSAGESLLLDHSSQTRNYLGYQVQVKDAAGAVLLSRTVLAQRRRTSGSVPTTGEFDLGNWGTASVFQYPGQDRARVSVYPAAGRKITGARFTCGEQSVDAAVTADGGYSACVSTPSAPGHFAIGVGLKSADEEKAFPQAITLEKKSYPWLHNDLGKAEVILPPFTPIVAADNAFEVLLRRQTLTAEALPGQVTALGRDLLAEAAHYEIVTDSGQTERFIGEMPRLHVRKGGYEAETSTRGTTASGVALTTDVQLAYDGFQKNEVRLTGVAGRMVERLTLVIPFKDAEVPLWHICTADSIRYNPTGALPQGEGLIWEGTRLYRKSEFLDPMMAPQLVPYIWLGAERRGLSWCLNNSCGFRLDAAKPSVRIFREKGVVRVEIDIINRPVRLREGHAFAFAFEATPVKMPDRALMRHFQATNGGVPEGFICRKPIDWINLGYFNMWARGPADGEWRTYAATCRRVREGTAYADFFADMTNGWERLEPLRAAYAAPMQNVGKSTYHRWMRSCWRGNVGYFNSIPAGSFSMQYSDPTLTWNRDPALKDFKSEWISRGTGYIGATRNFLVPSYMDYVVWYHREQMRQGLDGIYMDDMFPMACRNPDTAMLQDDEGRWHGNLGIFEMRELVRRVAVLQHEMGRRPRLLQVHMTNCLLVPCFAFATSTISWEDHYGEDEFQKRFPLDYIRAESLGTQVGCESVALDGIYRGTYDEKAWRHGHFAFLTRTQIALQLPLGVKPTRRPQLPFAGYDAKTLYSVWNVLGRFRIWEEDCSFVPSFEDDGAVSGVPKGVLVGSWRRKGEMLVIFGNQDGTEKVFTPVLDRTALRLAPAARPYDAETGTPIPDGRLTLRAWDYAFVRYTGFKVLDH